MKVGEYEIRKGLFYTKDHEWTRIEGKKAFVGITDYAVKEMGDVAYVELPETGIEVKKGDLLCEIESVKAVSEVFSPVDGVVSSVNGTLENSPEAMNEDPYGTWIAQIDIDGEPKELMSEEEYASFLETLE
ncbi:MAG: glycine cleavage system protein GcvH [Candidatus Methanofastidiosia archaeon]